MNGQADDRKACRPRPDRRKGPPQPAGVVFRAARSLVSHQFSAAC